MAILLRPNRTRRFVFVALREVLLLMSHMLQGKKILLGVCGSIAAYKAAVLLRLLVKQGAQVRVLMTQSATDFITPLTLATLSKNEVWTGFYQSSDGVWHNHVELGLWADLFVIAPATANTLSKMANGECSQILLATYLSARCPVWVAPAMDLDMWLHPATQRNIAALQSYGNRIIPVGKGELASGLSGEGRMAEPEYIAQQIAEYFAGKQQAMLPPPAPLAETQPNALPMPRQDLAGKRILLNAGPTYEPIDPVRYIGNRSSGKMGIALAEACYEHGAQVTLVLGPTHLRPRYEGIELISVETAADMFRATVDAFLLCDIAILTAAVADYTPAEVSPTKIKKKETSLSLDLKKTRDILAYLGSLKQERHILAGFALETDNEQANAIDKLQRKNLDFIILNSLQDKGAGFKHDTNKITIIDRNAHITRYDLQAKTAIAQHIVAYLLQYMTEKTQS